MMPMNPDDVARYLKDHPEFFERYAEQMAEIYVPHPHGGRAIPLSERQMLALREKNKLLEEKLRELIGFGEENDAIGEKMHRLSLALMAAPDLASALYVLAFNLREDFGVPHVAMRVWGVERDSLDLPELAPVSADVRALAEGLTQGHCGGHIPPELLAWFGEAGAHLRSFALVPLRYGRTLGLLVLASEDSRRFYPEMGTVYLGRLGELAGAAVARFNACS
ncbi:DUF484 family protein [Pelomicrobium sp.]|jgi:uncharacterized protein YigA (DUF484 family)|uniref:DUF484 family protein n=1 Tax=Pelomicrobium sp. TaxID=2815319 RepID=UPI002FDC8750